MRDRAADRPRRRLTLLAQVCLIFYALLVCATPFEHHDLSCELKTPQHCAACSLTALSADPGTITASAWCQLTDAGRAISINVTCESLLLVVHSTGRSPPPAI